MNDVSLTTKPMNKTNNKMIWAKCLTKDEQKEGKAAVVKGAGGPERGETTIRLTARARTQL